MSRNRFLLSYAIVPAIGTLTAATAASLFLREMRAPFLYALCSLAVLVVIYFVFFLRAIMACCRAHRQGSDHPRALTMCLIFAAAFALWGAGLGGALLIHDRPPFRDAVIEGNFAISNLVRAETRLKGAKGANLTKAIADLESSYDRLDFARDQLRLHGPRYGLACLILFIGVIAGLASVVVLFITCCRVVIGSGAVHLAT